VKVSDFLRRYQLSGELPDDEKTGRRRVKVSDFLRRYQLSGELPDDKGDSMLNFYAGWLIGAAAYKGTLIDLDQARDFAIKVSEFIEARARE
jgi:hypothetical protein